MNRFPPRSLSASIVLLAFIYVPAYEAQTYKSVATFKVTLGRPAAVAVDSAKRRLYVAGSGGVEVLNADNGVPLGAIRGIKSATDVVIIPGKDEEGSRAPTTGFAATEAGVARFDLASERAGDSAPSSGATSLCYDSLTNTVVAVGADSLTSIDADNGKVIATGRLHAGSGQIACGTLDHVYVADPDANVIHVLNHNTMQIDGDYPVPACSKPSGLTLDTKGRRLFVSCEDGAVDVIDTDAGFTFIHMHSGSGAAHGIFAWTPQGEGRWKAGAFFAHQDGTVSGIRMMAYINYTLGGEWKVAPKIGSIAYDAKSHRLFVVSSSEDSPEILVLGY